MERQGDQKDTRTVRGGENMSCHDREQSDDPWSQMKLRASFWAEVSEVFQGWSEGWEGCRKGFRRSGRL